MKKTIQILILIFAINLTAQKDTIYFNSAWNKTIKEKAEYFRPMPLKKVGNLYQIKDYYIKGNIQMEGFWLDLTNETFEGKASWYYKNGQVQQTLNYKRGLLEGQSVFYTKEGFLRAKGAYKNNDFFSGTFQSRCCPGRVTEYENGKKTAYLTFYKNQKELAKKEFFIEGNISKIQYFNKNEEPIGEISYKDDEAVTGTFIWFYMDDFETLSIKTIINYQNGKREGKLISFDKNGTQIAKGICKEDDFWEGTFLKNNNQIATYKNGRLDGRQVEFYTDDYQKIRSYKYLVNNKKEGESAFFDKNGKQIAKGIYKNDIPFTGTFYDAQNKTLTTYKEGKKHGLFIQYNNDGNVRVQQEYNNDKRTGVVESIGAFKNRKCTSIYKNGTPFKGEKCENLSVLTYRNGKITKKSNYKRETQDKIEETQFYNDKEEIIKKNTYNNKTKYTLVLKEGKPYKGKIYSTYNQGLLTYKEGHLHGLFTENTYNNVLIQGTYKNDLLDGLLTFKDKRYNKTTTCTYKKNKPIEGTVIENNCVTTYKNGFKSGLEQCKNNLYFKKNNEYKLIYDSIVNTYKKGKLNGIVRYLKKGKLVSTAQYYEDHIYQGTTYVKKTFENYYENNKLIRSTYYFGAYKTIEIYKNWLITNETTYKENKIVYQGHFKNGEAYNGSFITIDDKEEPREYKVTYYENGKKHGKEQVINLINNTIEESTIYKKGVPMKTTKKFPFKGADSIEGIFKKRKPFSGHFYSKESTIEKIEHYKKGVKTGMQYYYSTTGSQLKKPLDSIKYIKGKPIDGVDIEVINKDDYKYFYKNGKLTKIDVYDIYYQGITNPPLFKITPTKTGFITFKSTENTFKKHNELTYTTTDKTEGKVEFFTEKEKGYLKYKNKSLTDIQIKVKFPHVEFNMYLEKPNVLLADAKFKDLRIKMYPEFKLSATPNYKDFLAINDLFFRGSGMAYFYIDENLLSTCRIKKGKGHQGIVIKEDKKGLFMYRKYQQGKPIETRKRLTKKKLIKLLAKQRKHETK